jgi:hypothetical protein
VLSAMLAVFIMVAFLMYRRKHLKTQSLVSVVEPLAQYAANPLFSFNYCGQAKQTSNLQLQPLDDGLFYSYDNQVVPLPTNIDGNIFYPAGDESEQKILCEGQLNVNVTSMTAAPEVGDDRVYAMAQSDGRNNVLYDQRTTLADSNDLSSTTVYSIPMKHEPQYQLATRQTKLDFDV